MHDDKIARMLKDDFEDHAQRLDNDRFTRRVMFRLGAMRRRRHGAIIGAGALGALIAASQFQGAVQSIAPSLAERAHGDLHQLLAMVMVGGVMAASAFVLHQEN